MSLLHVFLLLLVFASHTIGNIQLIHYTLRKMEKLRGLTHDKRNYSWAQIIET